MSLEEKIMNLLLEAQASGEIASFGSNSGQPGEHVWNSPFDPPVAYRRIGPIVTTITITYPFDMAKEDLHVRQELDKKLSR